MKLTRFLVAGAALTAISLSFADDKAGWTDLFDGKTLNGWKHSTLGTATYSVEDGAIKGVTVEGSPNSFLLSENLYGDFELEFEVKVHDKLNSGCQIRSREKTEADMPPPAPETADDGKKKKKKPKRDLGRFFGPQVEIEASPGQSAYIYGEATGRGWISEEPKAKVDPKNKPEGGAGAHNHMKNGEWNKLRIVAKGNNIQTWINGNAVANLTDDGIYETHPKGHIGLQVHGIKKGTGPYDVYWKNIRIKTL